MVRFEKSTFVISLMICLSFGLHLAEIPPMLTPSILDTGIYLPETIVNNQDIVKRVSKSGFSLLALTLKRAFRGNERRFADESMQTSDMAANAARSILAKPDCPKIDLLIFAACSGDLLEPATANIVQHKLGLTCPVMDIKNACNSMTSALQVACAFVESGIYRNVLLVCGEKSSGVINFEPKDHAQFLRSVPGYTLGDAGVAMLVGPGETRKVIYHKFESYGDHWDLCTVAGGGSMHFRDHNKYYFEGDAAGLHAVIKSKATTFMQDALDDLGLTTQDIDWVVPHQIATTVVRSISDYVGIPLERFVDNFPFYGNTAAASIPLALHTAVTDGRIKPGQRVMLLGLAAGVSISIQVVEW